MSISSATEVIHNPIFIFVHNFTIVTKWQQRNEINLDDNGHKKNKTIMITKMTTRLAGIKITYMTKRKMIATSTKVTQMWHHSKRGEKLSSSLLVSTTSTSNHHCHQQHINIVNFAWPSITPSISTADGSQLLMQWRHMTMATKTNKNDGHKPTTKSYVNINTATSHHCPWSCSCCTNNKSQRTNSKNIVIIIITITSIYHQKYLQK